MKKILVLGGRGFLGRHLCEALNREEMHVCVLTRKPQAASIQTLPFVTSIQADVTHQATLEALLEEAHAVVNLVATLHGSALEFERLHVQLPQTLATLCAKHRVPHVLHVSALGVRNDAQGPSMYLRSKGRGEQALVRALNHSHTQLDIFRPSVMFGQDDHFIQLFARLHAHFALLPLGSAQARFQPVWVQDVAKALVTVLKHPKPLTRGASDQPSILSIGPGPARIHELAGPQTLSLAEIVEFAGQLQAHPAKVIALPEWAAWLQALCFQMLPGTPLMSTDNVASMRVPNVLSHEYPGLKELGIQPKSLLSVFAPALHPRATPSMAPKQ